MCFLHVRFCSVSVRETELWLTCSVRFWQNGKTLLRSVTNVFNPIFVFQPESCPEADSSMSQDRRSGSFGYRRRSKSMERKDSVRRRSLDNEANDESSLTVEKGRIF